MPTASVSVVRVYSTRIARGRVIRQRPARGRGSRTAREVTLAVSKGSPFTDVPAILAGTAADSGQRRILERHGFRVRYRYTPSWSVHKGTLIELQPSAGTRVRRPATMRVVVSSGFPRAVVPDVQNVDLEIGAGQLEAKHLRYGSFTGLRTALRRTTWPRAHPSRARPLRRPRVGSPLPAGRWRAVFADSGSGEYESAPFDCPGQVADPLPARRRRRRLGRDGRDRVGAGRRFLRLRDGSIVAETPGSLKVHRVGDGAGTYRLTVRPDVREMSWYVEVDARE